MARIIGLEVFDDVRPADTEKPAAEAPDTPEPADTEKPARRSTRKKG